MRTLLIFLLFLGACQRQLPESPQNLPEPPPQALHVELPQPDTPVQPIQQPLELPDAPTDFVDFAQPNARPGDVLIWRRLDDAQFDETIWLAVQATGTEELARRPGLWLATATGIWQWHVQLEDLAVCGTMGCEEDPPRCKAQKKTGEGLVDRVSWQNLLTEQEIALGPRLPPTTPVGLNAQGLQETWLPLALLDGTLVVRVEARWRPCDAEAQHGGGRTQVLRVAPPQPTLRPFALQTAGIPAEVRALPGGEQAKWAGLHQILEQDGRWRIEDEWAVPLPDSPTESAPLTEIVQVAAGRLPSELAGQALEAPRIQQPPRAWTGAGGETQRLGWSRLNVPAEKRAELLQAFLAEPHSRRRR